MIFSELLKKIDFFKISKKIKQLKRCISNIDNIFSYMTRIALNSCHQGDIFKVENENEFYFLFFKISFFLVMGKSPLAAAIFSPVKEWPSQNLKKNLLYQ